MNLTRSIVLFVSIFVVGEAYGESEPIQEQNATKVREVIVSHGDDKGILQLFRVREDGKNPVQLTDSRGGCRMPSVSPDGQKLLFVEASSQGMSLCMSDIQGENKKILVREGMNLIPSWVPDGIHVVWMKAKPGDGRQDPASNSQIFLMNTETGESRRLFTDPEQIKYSNAMPVVSPASERIAFVSNRSGQFRVWVSNLDGSDARMVSRPARELDKRLQLPIEQKVPAWSPDGKWIAHWEGVEMIHMSPFTGIQNPERDRQIASTFHVWIVSADGKERRQVGRGDDPVWSLDGYVSRAFPDPQRGGPVIIIETDSGEKKLPIVPPHKNWGRFCWIPD